MEISGIFVNYWEITKGQKLSEKNNNCEIIYSRHML